MNRVVRVVALCIFASVHNASPHFLVDVVLEELDMEDQQGGACGGRCRGGASPTGEGE